MILKIEKDNKNKELCQRILSTYASSIFKLKYDFLSQIKT